MVWAGIGASYLLVLAAAWIFRVDVVRIWPNTASAYAALGGKVSYYGLEIRDIAMTRTINGGASVIQISGQVVNISKKPKPVPLLQAEIFDENGKTLFSWLIEPEQQSLEKDSKLAFVSEIRDPPPGKLQFEIGFSNEKPAPSKPDTADKKAPAEPEHAPEDADDGH